MNQGFLLSPVGRMQQGINVLRTNLWSGGKEFDYS